MTKHCRTCSCDEPGFVPPEPPVGTWVRDKYGGVSVRRIDEDGRDGWSPGPGFYSTAVWKDFWLARGPLIECGEWGRDL